MSLVCTLGDPVVADVITQPLISILPDNPLSGLLDFIRTPPDVNYGKLVDPFIEGSLTTPTENSNGPYRKAMLIAENLNEQLQNAGIALLSIYLAYFLVAWGAGLKQGSQAVREGAKIIGAVAVIVLSPTVLWELLSVSRELAPAISDTLQSAYTQAYVDANSPEDSGLGTAITDGVDFAEGLILSVSITFGAMCMFLVLVLVDYLRMTLIIAGFSFMPLFIAASLFSGPADSVGRFGKKGITYTISAIFLPVPMTVALNFSIITFQILPTPVDPGIEGLILIAVMLIGVWAGLKATAAGGKIGSTVKGAAFAGLAVAGGFAAGAGMIGSSGGSVAAGVSRAGRTAGKLGMSRFGGREGRAAANEVFGQREQGGTRDPTPNEEESDTGDGETSAATDYRTQDDASGGGGRGGYSSGGGTQAASTGAQATQNMGQMVQDTRVQATPVRDAAMAPDDDSDKVAAATEMKAATDSEVNFSSPVQPDPRDLNDQLDRDATNEVMQAWNIDPGLDDTERVNAVQNAADVSGKHLEYEDLNQKQQTALGDVGIEQQEYAERRLTNGDIETTYGTDKDSVRKDLNTAYGSLDRAKQEKPEAVNTLTTVDATNKAQNMMGVGANTANKSADGIFTEITGVNPKPGSKGQSPDESTVDMYAREYDRIMGLGNYTDPGNPDADLLDPEDHPEAAKAYFTAMENTNAHSDDLTYTDNGITIGDDQYDRNGARMPGGHTTNARMAGHAGNGTSNMKAHTTMLEGAGLALNSDEIQDLHGSSSDILVNPDPADTNHPHPSQVAPSRQTDSTLVSEQDEVNDAFKLVTSQANPYGRDNIDDKAIDTLRNATLTSSADSTPIGKNGGATGFDNIDDMIEQYSGMSSTLENRDEHDETPSGFFR